MEPSEQERATECVTPAEVMAKMKAVSRQPEKGKLGWVVVGEENEVQPAPSSGQPEALEFHAPWHWRAWL